MTRLFGVEDDFGEDAILGRIEGMKDVIEQVNQQFRDPVSPLFTMFRFSKLMCCAYPNLLQSLSYVISCLLFGGMTFWAQNSDFGLPNPTSCY